MRTRRVLSERATSQDPSAQRSPHQESRRIDGLDGCLRHSHQLRFPLPSQQIAKGCENMVCSHRRTTNAEGHVDLQIQKNAQLDSYQSTLWLRSSSRNGSFLKAVCVDALEELDFRLWELSAKMEQSPGHMITFYLRSMEKDVAARRPQDPILLFCAIMDPQKRKMKYLGSVEAAKNATLQSVFSGPVGALKDRINAECSFIYVHPENCISRTSPSCQIVTQVVRPCLS